MTNETLAMRRMLLRPVEAWTLQDLQELVDSRLSEGQRIEYKRELNVVKDRQKTELAKDVSGLANAQGGLIVFGIAEHETEADPLPSEVTPFPGAGVQTRLENILDSALEPIPDYCAATIDAGEGRVVLVLRVEPHPGPPVMVQAYGEHRYYVRSGTRTRPMNATEVACAHEKAASRTDRLMNRLRRLPLSLRVTGAPRPNSETSMPPVMGVVMAAIDAAGELLTPERVTRHGFELRMDGYRDGIDGIRPTLNWTIVADGLADDLRHPDEPQKVLRRFAIYRPGVIEWVRRDSRDPFKIPSVTFADQVHDVLLYGARIFDELGYHGRLATWVRIENAEQAELMIPRGWDASTRPPEVDVLNAYQEVSADELLLDRTATVRNAMDRIWQGFGLQRCGLFEPDGDWLRSPWRA
jgi:hypothetical protein